MTETTLLQALRDCYDPALACNIVDLGLVREATLRPDPDAPGHAIPGVPARHRVDLTLTLTQPSDDNEASLRAQVQNRLAGLEAVSRTTVRFLHTPAWTPQQITPEGRRLLKLDGNPRLIQISGSPR